MNVWCHLPTILSRRRVFRFFGILTLCVALTTTLFSAIPARAAAGINQTLSFQGRLLNSTGGVVPDGYYNIQFKIYQDGDGTQAGDTGGTGGALKWTESYVNNGGTNGVQVTDGFFSVNLGSQNPFGTSVDWNQDTLWLSMNVAGSSASCTTFGTSPCTADGEMLPMKRITSTPYAMNAGMLGGITSAGFIQNGTSQQAAANFNISGTGIAATLQGSTSVVSSLFDTSSNTTLNIGTVTASGVTIGRTGGSNTIQGSTVFTGSQTFNGTTSNNTTLYLSNTVSSSITSSMYGIQNEVSFNPQGGSISNIYGATSAPTITGSSLTVGTYAGSYSRINTGAGFTGTITTGSGIMVADPTLSGAGDANGIKISNYAGVRVVSTSNNTGNTGGTITNSGITVQGGTASAGSGGTLNNYSLNVGLSSGTSISGTTQNVGIYLTGNGGTNATNYAIYNSSTAANYLQGNVSIGTASNPSSYALNVSGNTNTSGQYLIGGSTILTNTALTFGGTSSSTITAASGQSLGLSSSSNVTITAGGTTTATFGSGNLQVGSGSGTGQPILLTLDRASSTPTASGSGLIGSMYYDTSKNAVQCYNGSGWGSCNVAPTTSVSLAPEYSGAVLQGSGSGTMTAGVCSDTLHINDGTSGQPTICGTNETYNFYDWTSTSGSSQSYNIFVNYPLPSNFTGFASGSASLMGRTDSSNSSVSYQVYRKSSSGTLSTCGSSVSVSTGVQTTWQKATASGSADPSACSFAAGDSLVIKVTASAQSNANAYIGNLNFAYSTQ